MRTAVAYIRRSVSRRSDPGDLSREFQTDRVRALGNGEARDLRIVDQDWGRSAATEGTAKRLAFLEVLESIERGDVSTLYAFSADRLARSVEWSARLWNACQRTGTGIVTTLKTYDTADESDWMLFHFEALANEQALRGMVTKARATAARRRSRGDRMGRVPYGGDRLKFPGEDPAVIVEAFVREGSYLEAARALNTAGVPTRYVNEAIRQRESGKDVPIPATSWDPTTVRHVVARHAPALVPLRPRKGARTNATRVLAGLLVCHCGAILTSMPTASGVSYYCRRGHHDPRHPRPYQVSERKILPFVRAAFEEILLPGVALGAVDVAGRRRSAEERLHRADELYLALRIDADRYAEIRTRTEADLAELAEAATSIRVEPIDWENTSPAEINAVLRRAFREVRLDSDMKPVSARKRVTAVGRAA